MATGITNKGLDSKNAVSSKMLLCDNITDTAIRITESKARLVYRDHLIHASGERVISAFSLFLTFLLTLLTSDFKDILGIENSKYILNAIFVILAIVFGVATIILFIKWIYEKKSKNENAFICALKGSEDDADANP